MIKIKYCSTAKNENGEDAKYKLNNYYNNLKKEDTL